MNAKMGVAREELSILSTAANKAGINENRRKKHIKSSLKNK